MTQVMKHTHDMARARMLEQIGESGAAAIQTNAEAKAIFDCAVRALGEAISATYQPENWLKEPPKGEMFIWARPNDRGGWGLGLGYWNKSGSWSDAYGSNPNATRFHALPAPPQ